MFDYLLEYVGAVGRYWGSQLGELAENAAVGLFAWAMHGIWSAAVWLLKGAFRLADRLSVFSITEDGGPVETTWPMTLWISGVVALALFFWQLTMTAVRGGRGFVRLVSGPAQYGIALGVTVGMVAALLVAADELTRGLLSTGLDATSFRDALRQTAFSAEGIDGVKAIALGLCALFGILPAAFGYVLEMLFREAAIHLLIAVVPVTAAGLTANSTASWFWTTLRWILAAVLMKPVIALTLVLGVAIADGAKGVTGILVGSAVLLMSLFAPLALFRLFAFVDPRTDAGGTFRHTLAGFGVSSYGPGNPVAGWQSGHLRDAADRARGGDGDGGDGGDDSTDLAEARTAQRMDSAAEGYNPFAYRGDANSGDSSGGSGARGSGADTSESPSGESQEEGAGDDNPAGDMVDPAVAESPGGASAADDVVIAAPADGPGPAATSPPSYGGGPAAAAPPVDEPPAPLGDQQTTGSRHAAEHPDEFDDGAVE